MALSVSRGRRSWTSGSVSWALARRLIRVDHIALPNLVAGARIVPELVQREVKARRLAALLVTLLDVDAPERTKQLDAFRDVRERLGGPGAGERVADLAEELLDR